MTVTPAAGWHPEETALQDYVDGRLPGLSAGSVEAHLMSCPACRHAVRDAVPVPRLTALRDRLDDRLDVVHRPRLERLLTWLGVAEVDARALLAAPNLRRAWWLAVVAAAVLALLVAGSAEHPDAVFLVLAPLLPLSATALAYAPGLDPAFALVSATPYRTARLLLARSLAVGSASMLLVAAVALALPAQRVTAVGWLLPATALTLVVLALAPRLGAAASGAAVGTAWLVLVGLLERRGADLDWVTEAAAQGIWALVAALSLLAVRQQWARLEGGRL